MSIKELRERVGISQWAAAQRSGISRMRLSLAETGQLTLKPDEEAVLQRVLREAVQAQQARLNELLRESVVST